MEFSLDPKFSDPILWPIDQAIPTNLKVEVVERGQFEEAEMAAFDELPKTIRKLFQQHNINKGNVVFQLLLKGLKFGEFTETQVYLAILQRMPNDALEISAGERRIKRA